MVDQFVSGINTLCNHFKPYELWLGLRHLSSDLRSNYFPLVFIRCIECPSIASREWHLGMRLVACD